MNTPVWWYRRGNTGVIGDNDGSGCSSSYLTIVVNPSVFVEGSQVEAFPQAVEVPYLNSNNHKQPVKMLKHQSKQDFLPQEAAGRWFPWRQPSGLELERVRRVTWRAGGKSKVLLRQNSRPIRSMVTSQWTDKKHDVRTMFLNIGRTHSPDTGTQAPGWSTVRMLLWLLLSAITVHCCE